MLNEWSATLESDNVRFARHPTGTGADDTPIVAKCRIHLDAPPFFFLRMGISHLFHPTESGPFLDLAEPTNVDSRTSTFESRKALVTASPKL
jgi:hypothetical protein